MFVWRIGDVWRGREQVRYANMYAYTALNAHTYTYTYTRKNAHLGPVVVQTNIN